MIKKKAIKIIDEKEKDEEDEKPQEVKPRKPPALRIKKLYVPKYLATADEEDDSKFDYVAERSSEQTAKLFEATLHLVSESLTACLMCTNELYIRNGFVSSILTNGFLACMMAYCAYSVTRSVQNVYGIIKVPMMSYPDLAQASIDLSSYPILRKYGGRFKSAVIAVVIVRLFAKCCVYQIVMARCLHHLIYRVADTSPNNTRKYLGLLIVPCILIGMLRAIEYIAPFSFVSIGFIAFFFIYVMIFGLLKPPFAFRKYKLINDVTDFFSFCGGCVFTMDTSCAVLSVENTMSRPGKMYIVIIVGNLQNKAVTGFEFGLAITGVLITTVMVICMGFVGGFGWGPNAKAPVTLTFKMRVIPYSDFFQIGLILSSYISFALHFWLLFNFLWAKLKFLHPLDKHRIFESLYRAGFVLVITMLGMLFPDLSGIISFFGGLASGVLNFIFPPIIEFLISTRGKRLGKFNWKMFRLIAIMSFGWIFVLAGTFFGLRDIFLNVYFTSV